MKQMKNFFQKYYDYIILAAIYGFLHVFIHTDYWDDASLPAIMKSYNYNLPGYLIDTWNTWSSALFIRTIQVLVSAFPNYIWKTCDVLMILISYHYFMESVKLLISHMPTHVPSIFERKWCLLFFLSFPYCLFATAGWMITTIAYAWIFSAFFYCLHLYLSASMNALRRPLKWYSYVVFGLVALYCANCKLMPFSLAAVFILVYLNCKNKSKTFYILFWEGMLASLVNMAMFFLCPGHRARNIEDARFHNTAELLTLPVGGHLRMGINSAFYHFISIPNAILFTFCLLTAVCVFIKTKKPSLRICACIPLALDVFWTGYAFLHYTLPRRTLTYIYPDASFQECPMAEQYAVLASALVMVLLICFLLAFLTDYSYLSLMLIGIMLAVGLFPCVALGFTTTVSASIMRIASFFYFSLILCACVLIHIYPVLKNKFWKSVFYLLGFLGSLMNILQIIRHIIVYG